MRRSIDAQGAYSGWLPLSSVVLDSAKLCFFPLCSCLVHSLIDAGNLFYPLPTVTMFHVRNLVMVPMKVICNKGYLLIQLIEGVAYNPPMTGRSISNAW